MQTGAVLRQLPLEPMSFEELHNLPAAKRPLSPSLPPDPDPQGLETQAGPVTWQEGWARAALARAAVGLRARPVEGTQRVSQQGLFLIAG